jgi:uroporphyrinogen decarboxylase
MTKRERLKSVANGEAVDRPPVAFWRHFYDLEQSTDGLIDAMTQFQKTFDWDFLKINPRACYHFQDWGNEYEFDRDGSAAPKLTKHRIENPEDWRNLERLAPSDGVLGDHIHAITAIKENLANETPLAMTVFTPLSIAAELAGDDRLADHIKRHPDDVHVGLNAITDSFYDAISACFEAGAEGIFYATRGWGTNDRLTDDEYDTFSRPYDVRLMNLMDDRGWLNILHICRSNNMLQKMLDLPDCWFNWDAVDPTNPSIAEAAELCRRTLIGGVDADKLASDGPGNWLDRQLNECARVTNNKRWIVGGGCTAPATISDSALMRVRELAEEIG